MPFIPKVAESNELLAQALAAGWPTFTVAHEEEELLQEAEFRLTRKATMPIPEKGVDTRTFHLAAAEYLSTTWEKEMTDHEMKALSHHINMYLL